MLQKNQKELLLGWTRGPSTAAKTDRGRCGMGNCTFGKIPLGNCGSEKISLGKYLASTIIISKQPVLFMNNMCICQGA